VVSLAAWTVFLAFAWAAVTIVATAVLGRFVCGWVCPLGALHQAFAWLFKKTGLLRPRKVVTGGLWWKYAVLAVVLVTAVFGLDLAGLLDPLSFLYRTASVSLVPAFSQGFNMAVGAAYSAGLTGIGDAMAQQR
jgi:polyferredoxin